MFARTQRFYDLVYSWKDYAAEAEHLHAVVQSRKRTAGNRLLDVACGTGKHMELLRGRYEVEGLDLDAGMLAIAGERLPGVKLHHGDLRHFDLGRRYDVAVCLFSSIAYAHNTDELARAVACLAAHVEAGGVLVVEPFLTPDQFRAGHVQMLCVDEPDLKISRMARGETHDGRARFDFQYLIGQPDGIEHIDESHDLSLFQLDAYVDAFRPTGMVLEHDAEGLMGRGLFLAVKPD